MSTQSSHKSFGHKLKHSLTKVFRRRPAAIPVSRQTGDLILGPERRDALGTTYRPFRTFSADGLALAGRHYGDPDAPPPPVLCVPGLSRNVRDFEPLFRHFARTRRVVAVDLRGRGASEYDDDALNYNPLTESQDVMTIMDRLALPKPVLIGTSRGGIVAMMIASQRPDPFAGVVLNDIGPVIELQGLLKIKSYVGRTEMPSDWDGATEWVGRLMQDAFPDLDRRAYERMAERLFRDFGGRPLPDYDPKLGNGMEFLTPLTLLPTMWPQFAALSGCPVLVLRGANSDILSVETLEAMKAAHPRLTAVEVVGQGHAPLLEDEATLNRIGAFLETCA